MGVPQGARSEWAVRWQRSWDRLEDALVPERERLIGTLLDVVEAMAGPAPIVIDLACGPGSITSRLLDRLPQARSIAVDVDPVLLTIASAAFADDGRVQVARADLRDRGWLDVLPDARVDAVVTSTALHWLPEEAVRRLYRDLAGLVGEGGIVAHSEQMPVSDLPRIWPSLARLDRRRRADPEERRARWDAWWEQASRDPALEPAIEQRRAVFETTYPTEEFSPSAEWHITAMRDAGFAEAGVVWRSGPAAVIAAAR